jgi:hypothetical protein
MALVLKALSSITLLTYLNAASAAPSPSLFSRATHRRHQIMDGLEIRSYHPPSTFEVGFLFPAFHHITCELTRT